MVWPPPWWPYGRDAGILYTEQDFATKTLRITDGHGADLLIDGVGRTTFRGNLQATAVRGYVLIFGAASGPAEPISPTVLVTLSGGDLRHSLPTVTRDDLVAELSERIGAVVVLPR